VAEATEQLRIVINAQDNASAVVKNVGNTIQSVLSNAVSGAAAGVGFAAFNQLAQSVGQAFDFAKNSIVSFNASLEQSRIAWSTMLGGGEQAEAMLKRIQTFAASTPFGFPQVEQAARRFVAMGIAAGDVIPLMRSVGAAAIAVGAGSDGVNRISLALGQMSTRTKVTAEDMMQLTEVGIPAWRILAEATRSPKARCRPM
jgi:tape measure domain-containing protein